MRITMRVWAEVPDPDDTGTIDYAVGAMYDTLFRALSVGDYRFGVDQGQVQLQLPLSGEQVTFRLPPPRAAA